MFTPYQRFQQWLAKFSPLVWKSDCQRLEKRLGEIMQQLNTASGTRRELESQLARTELEKSTLAGHQDFIRDELRQRLQAMEVTNSQQAAQIARQELEIQRLSDLTITDALTGILNYRGLLELAIPAINRRCHEIVPGPDEHRRRPTVTALYIDLDNFKDANDHHDHAWGDQVLCRVAAHLKQHLGRRPSDIVARKGGDEFVVILTDTDQMNVQQRAEQFRRAVANDRWLQIIEGELGVTASIGISRIELRYNSDPAEILRVVMSQADTLLKCVKSSGRKNRVSVGGDITEWSGLPK